MTAAPPPPPPSKPEAIQHLAQARLDYALYQELKRHGNYLDWAVTLLFYTAMHLAEACLVEHHKRSGYKTHNQRDLAVYNYIRPIYRNYNLLHDRSSWARYHPAKPDPTPQNLQQYETEWFSPIANHLSQRGVVLSP